MIEQKCLYQEMDGKDEMSMHLMLYNEGILNGYARVLFDEQKNALSFGRLVTPKSVRKKGLGKELMNAIMSYIKEHHNHQPIVISAQCYLQSFYEQYHFVAQGTSYLEDGLPHIKMYHNGQHHDD